MDRFKHIGVDAFLTMRKKLLYDYEVAKDQTHDDAAKVEHGNVGESVVRNWLEEFLPKRFGVCKGYIITNNLDYSGPLEEWDIIIYDGLVSPILFTRDSKKAIPIEYVRGVIEVKSTLNNKSAKKAEQKLRKLHKFIGENKSQTYPNFLTQLFIASMIFFEIGVKNLNQYRLSLNSIAKIYQPDNKLPFMGSLILKSSKNPNHTGYLQAFISDTPTFKEPIFEMSTPFRYSEDKYGSFGSSGFGVNSFTEYIFDLLSFLKGEKTNKVSSFYGLDYENSTCSRLFH